MLRIERYRRHGSPEMAGRREAALWQRGGEMTTTGHHCHSGNRAQRGYPESSQVENASGFRVRAFGAPRNDGQRGASIITIWRPSNRGSDSTLAILPMSSLTRLSSL